MSSNTLPLRPVTIPLIDNFLSQTVLVNCIVTALGSPVNILFPQALAPNLHSFQLVLAKHALARNSRIFFAHKANQSHSLLAEMSDTTLDVDVASANELKHALSCGFTGSRLQATGPKDPAFLYLCIKHGVVISVDSLNELGDVLAIKRSCRSSEKVRILLRLCGFKSTYKTVLAKQSRFGISVDDIAIAIAKINDCETDLELLGFAFHLDSTSLDERLIAIETCLNACDQSTAAGLTPEVINIGGGFRINYLINEEEWHAYKTAIAQAVLGTGPQVTWQNNSFGLIAESGGTIGGKFNSYPYFEPTPGASHLDEILQSPLPGRRNQTVAAQLRDNMISLWIEPGRAMLDQAGLTLAVVNTIKSSSAGDTLVLLNMQRSNIAYLDQEIFMDPILVTSEETNTQHVPVYLAGCRCLERDLILQHKVWLPRSPKPGDILAFVNTAAYMMDMSATEPIPVRAAVVQKNNAFTWMLDEKYTPIWSFNN